jgi:hypothetical protein
MKLGWSSGWDKQIRAEERGSQKGNRHHPEWH